VPYWRSEFSAKYTESRDGETMNPVPSPFPNVANTRRGERLLTRAAKLSQKRISQKTRRFIGGPPSIPDILAAPAAIQAASVAWER